MDAEPKPGAGLWRHAWLLLLVAPAVFLGRSLAPGRVLLPVDPVAFEPLASEDLERAARAMVDANLWVSDATLPFATDVLRQQQLTREGHPVRYAPDHGLGRGLRGGTLIEPTYLPNRLLVHLPLGRGAAALGWLHLAVAGLGLYLLLGRRGATPFGALAGALAIEAGGWGLMNLQLSMKVGAIAWLPLALWAVEDTLDGRWRGRAVLALSVSLMLSAGFPSIAAPALVALVGLSVARALARPALGQLPHVGLALVVGALLALPALAPMQRTAAASARAPEPAAELSRQGLPRAALLTLLSPHVFGEPDDALFAGSNPAAWTLLDADERHLGERANGLEWNLYGGLVVLVLAAAGLASRPRRALAPLGVGVLAVGFAFAAWPLRWLLVVPGLDVGAPTRAVALLWLAGPWLAGLGAGALAEGCRRALVGALLAATAVATTAFLLTPHDPREIVDRRQHAVAERFEVDLVEVERRMSHAQVLEVEELWTTTGWRVFGIGAGLALVLAVLGGLRRPRLVIAVVPALLLADGWRLASDHLVPRTSDEAFPASEGLEAIARATGEGRMARLTTGDVSGVERLARPDLPATLGIGDLAPYAVFTPRHELELVRAIAPQAPYRSGTGPFRDARVLDHPGLDLLRVTCVVSEVPLEHPSLTPVLEREAPEVQVPLGAPRALRDGASARREDLVEADDGTQAVRLRGHPFHVYARADAWPQGARLVPAVNATGSTFLEALAADAIDPLSVLCVDGETPEPVPTGWQPGALEVTHPAPHRVSAQVRESDGGWLVFPLGFSSGWTARIDGERAPVRRAQHALLAVRVPRGDSAVELDFRPPGARLGWLGLALGLWALVIGGLRARRRGA